MSEEKLYQDSIRGTRAKALLEDELLVDTFAYLIAAYKDAWMAAKTPELREQAWYTVHAIERVQDHIRTVLTNGTLAQHQIQELVKARSRRAA